MHNLSIWDHAALSEFRDVSRKELVTRYRTNTFVDRKVESIKKTPSGLSEAKDADDQTYLGKRVILAIGVRVTLPPIPGYADCWGESIFYCLFCRGYEEQSSTKAGVLAKGMLSNPQFALSVSSRSRRLAHGITIYTDGDETVRRALGEALVSSVLDVKTNHQRISKFEKLNLTSENKLAMHFKNGEREILRSLVHALDYEVNVPQA